MAHPLLKEEDKRWLEADQAALKSAVAALETSTLTAQISNVIGSPIEYVVEKLPKSAKESIHNAIQAALHKATEYALWTLEKDSMLIATEN